MDPLGAKESLSADSVAFGVVRDLLKELFASKYTEPERLREALGAKSNHLGMLNDCLKHTKDFIREDKSGVEDADERIPRAPGCSAY